MEETKFKMLEGVVKNAARDISLYLEQLDVGTFTVEQNICSVPCLALCLV